MSADQNKAMVQRFIDEIWNNRNLDVADEIFAADCMTQPRTPNRKLKGSLSGAIT